MIQASASHVDSTGIRTVASFISLPCEGRGGPGRGCVTWKIWTKARSLRNTATDAEQTLWRHLRGRQLQGLKFRRQYPIAGYIADFACVEAKLVIELDGGQHADRESYDAERTRKMETNGYRVLRFWNDDGLSRTTEVLDDIIRQLR